jgi:hypothetical protein
LTEGTVYSSLHYGGYIHTYRILLSAYYRKLEDTDRTTLFSFIGSNRNREIGKTELCVHMWDTHPEIRKIVHVEIKRLYFLGF